MLEIDKKNKSGFTLMELLVVISIIGLLAAIVLVALGNARAKARDARRKLDITEIQKAIEIYYLDNNSVYPNSGSVGNKDKAADIQNLASFLVPTYMAALPNDPESANGQNYQYIWNNNGQSYGLFVPFSNDGGTDCQIDSVGADNSKWWKVHGQPAPDCNL